jgi:hypothetical protein
VGIGRGETRDAEVTGCEVEAVEAANECALFAEGPVEEVIGSGVALEAGVQ